METFLAVFWFQRVFVIWILNYFFIFEHLLLVSHVFFDFIESFLIYIKFFFLVFTIFFIFEHLLLLVSHVFFSIELRLGHSLCVRFGIIFCNIQRMLCYFKLLFYIWTFIIIELRLGVFLCARFGEFNFLQYSKSALLFEF